MSSIAKLTLLLLATTAVSACGLLVVAHASCWPRERDALLALKEGINDTDDILASWQKLRHDDCCRWEGVVCSNETGHVTKLDIGGHAWLAGQISPSLLSLEHLEYLDLAGTSLLGPNGSTVFPEFLCSLQTLMHLDLSFTPYSGRVPARLANLSNLDYLDLSFTSLHGRAPEFLFSYKKMRNLDLTSTFFSGTLPRQLTNCSKLEYLGLSGTLFSGTLPPQLGNLSSLRHLDISYMQNIRTADVSWLTHLQFLDYLDMSDINLSSTADVFLVANTIPSLNALFLANCSLPNANQSLTHLNLTKLEQLDLSANYLGHRIDTSWFWNLTGITDLDIDETYLYGPFPDALGAMRSLQSLSFQNNGNSATMVVDLKNLCDLASLNIDGSLAFGNIREFLGKLPQCSSNKLYLSSNDNNMTGMLPDIVGHLTSLKGLFLSNNSITGAIPSWLRNLTSLTQLHLSLNQLTGQIPMLPRSLTGLAISMNSLSGPLPLDFGAPDLRELSLSSNYLTGHVPGAICESKKLDFMDLSKNLFDGDFPGCSAMPSMEFLMLNNNNLSGNFPSWLQNSSGLLFLDLAVNKFSGTLPTWIGEFVYLQFLLLDHNMFYGDIPVNITNLMRLQYFSLANNNISGSIPPSLSKLKAMTLEHPHRFGHVWYFEEQGNKGVLSVVMKRQGLKYDAIAVDQMFGIDISLNHLTGGLPDEITSLTGLVNLNLSWNHLSGKIPTKIGAMISLESLDLSRNNLSGEIPTSLSDLTYLISLDLSYDKLVGRIPTGRQLDTLYSENPSMYSGNIGLCGLPLENSCPGNNALEHGNQQTSVNGFDQVVFFYFGLTAGFVAGLWVVFCALLFKRAWRNAYFRLFDKLHDNAYTFIAVTWGMITSKTTTS